MKTLYVDNTVLTNEKRFTYLGNDAVSGATTITVQSIFQFSTNQILCIGEIGNSYTEIIKTSGSTSPTGTTITLASGLVFNHPQDTKVYLIDWNNVEFSWASTTGGSKTVLATNVIQPDLTETIYKDTVESTGYYFTRWKEDIGSTFSDYSDPIPFAGYADNTVFAIKQRALNSQNEELDPQLVTNDYLNESLWEARREYHTSPGKRPFRRKSNISIGTVNTGMYRVAVPSDLESPQTAENVFGVRIGVNDNMRYYDKKQWDFDQQGLAHAVLNSTYTIGNQDLYVDDVRQFTNTGGSVMIENDTVSYSATGISGGTLRISVQGTANHNNGLDVWQGAAFGLPINFTVFADAPQGSAYIYFNCPLSTMYASLDIFCDYYRTLVPYDSDADVLDEPGYDMFVPYLAYKIKKRKTSGLSQLNDPDYQIWLTKKNAALLKEYAGVDVRMRPDVEHLPIPS